VLRYIAHVHDNRLTHSFQRGAAKIAAATQSLGERDAGDQGEDVEGSGNGVGSSTTITPPTSPAPALASRFKSVELDLQRELSFLRTEVDVVKGKLAEVKKQLRAEIVAKQRAMKADSDAQATIQHLRNELKQLRQQYKITEEKYVEIAARNHDLEARIVEEKMKTAETLNSMNAMLQSQGKSVSVSILPHLKDLRATETTPKGDGGVAESAEKWTSRLGVKMPSEWTPLSDRGGISIPVIRFSAEGDLVVGGGSDGRIHMWSIETGREILGRGRDEPSVGQPVLNVDIKSNIILGTCDRVCYIWRLDRKVPLLEELHKLTGHTGSVVSGALTSDCRHAATGGRKVKIWDVETGDAVRTMDCFSKCLSLDVNGPGTLLVTGHGNKEVRLWDLRTGKRVDSIANLHAAAITSTSFSTDGATILTNGMDNRLSILEVRRLNDAKPVFLQDPEYRTNQWWSKSCLSPSSDLHGTSFAASGSKTGLLHIWDLSSDETDRSDFKQQAHSKPITCVSWSPRGSEIATVDNDGSVILWT